MNFQSVVDFFNEIIHIIQTISIIDILDILVVTVILFLAYRFVHERRASRLAIGILVLIAVLFIGNVVGMRVVQYFSSNIFQVGIIGILVLFQPEIRSALEKMGGGSIKTFKGFSDRKSNENLVAIREVVDAATQMSKEKTGALIVFERNTRLGEIVTTGSVLDAKAGSFLLRNIFFNKAPLHDGAVIISNEGRLLAAGCLLPLSQQSDINRNFGTRHRAAIGITESSDCVSVIVSEETGVISVAVNGNIKSGYDADALREELVTLLIKVTNKKTKGTEEDRNER